MSDWHDEFAEPMHDTPAEKDSLVAAMEAAGYTEFPTDLEGFKAFLEALQQTQYNVGLVASKDQLRNYFPVVVRIRRRVGDGSASLLHGADSRGESRNCNRLVHHGSPVF